MAEQTFKADFRQRRQEMKNVMMIAIVLMCAAVTAAVLYEPAGAQLGAQSEPVYLVRPRPGIAVRIGSWWNGTHGCNEMRNRELPRCQYVLEQSEYEAAVDRLFPR